MKFSQPSPASGRPRWATVTSTISLESTYLSKYSMPKTPAPGSYEAESIFEKSRKSGKGFGFGSGRNEMKATAFIKKN